MLGTVAATSDPLDLANALRAVGQSVAPAPSIDAAFFHRTLARWLGLPEGKVDGVLSPVQWDYRYWRAELSREPARDVHGRQAFAAALSAQEDAPAEQVRWWVLKDARGRIVDAGWDSTPPRLVDNTDLGAPGCGPVTDQARLSSADGPELLDHATLARLFGDDDGDGNNNDNDND